jgi:hypothetical protein
LVSPLGIVKTTVALKLTAPVFASLIAPSSTAALKYGPW